MIYIEMFIALKALLKACQILLETWKITYYAFHIFRETKIKSFYIARNIAGWIYVQDLKHANVRS